MGQEAHWVQPRVVPKAWDAGLGLGHEGWWREGAMRWQGCIDVTSSKWIYTKNGTGALLELMASIPSSVVVRAQELLLDVCQIHRPVPLFFDMSIAVAFNHVTIGPGTLLSRGDPLVVVGHVFWQGQIQGCVPMVVFRG